MVTFGGWNKNRINWVKVILVSRHKVLADPYVPTLPCDKYMKCKRQFETDYH